MRLPTTLTAVAAVAALATATGCLGIYGDISDLENDAWVHESGAPANVISNDYGIGFGFGGSAGAGLKVLTFGQNPGGVGLLSFDETGRLTSDGRPLPGGGFDFVENPPIAGLPSEIGNDRNVVIGVNNASAGGVILYSPNGLSDQIDVLDTTGNVVGVGLGPTDAGAVTVDVVAAHGMNDLTLFDDYDETTPLTCSLVNGDLTPVAAGRIVMTDFNNDGVFEVAVVAGTSVRIYSGANIAAGAMGLGNCGPPTALEGQATFQIDAPNGEADFGAQMVSGDFDGDGRADLAVAAPASNVVHVFLDPTAAATLVTVTPDATSAGFGAALAAGDISGNGRDELIIGAPDSTVNGASAAGQVEIRLFSGGSFIAPVFLRRAQAESNERYGRAVGVAAFNDTIDRVLVGADQKVFVNFQHPIDGDSDPRP